MRSVAVKSLFRYAIMNCDPVYTVNREQSFPDPIAAGRRKPTDTHVFLKNSHSAATSRAIAECYGWKREVLSAYGTAGQA